MDSNAIHHPSPAKKMKCLFLDYFQFWVISQAGRWTQTPSTTPLQPKNEMLIFGWCSTSDDQLGWSMDSNPICHPFQAKKMKCSFLYYIQLLIIGLVIGLKHHPPALSSQKKWNAHFWITFNFWWLAGLLHGLKPHLPPLSSQKNEMLVFGLCSTSDDWRGWSMDSNPICYPSPAKKWNAHFWITFNFGWSTRLVDGLKPHPPPLSSQKNAMLIFGLRSTSYDWPGWSMDSNPICHPSPTKKMKCSFLDYVQLLMIGQAGRRTPTCTHLQPLSNQKMKCLFLYYVIAQMISRVGRWTQNPSTTSQAKRMKC